VRSFSIRGGSKRERQQEKGAGEDVGSGAHPAYGF
jgi:hypothetical protein